MVIIACVEDRFGMAFNGRRVSSDVVLRERILKLTAGKRLWMDGYSWKSFAETPGAESAGIVVDEAFLEKAGKGEFCLIERAKPEEYRDLAEGVILFRWNRRYPADLYFDEGVLSRFRLERTEEFAGNSHETITMEVYG